MKSVAILKAKTGERESYLGFGNKYGMRKVGRNTVSSIYCYGSESSRGRGG